MPLTVEHPPIVPRPTVVAAFSRALRLRCPACGGRPTFLRWLRVSPACPHCGISFTRGERGYWLGAYFVSLVLVEAAFVALFGGLLWWTWPAPPWDAIEAGLTLTMCAVPFLVYPFSHTLFLAFDLLVRPPTPDDFVAPHEPARAAPRTPRGGRAG